VKERGIKKDREKERERESDPDQKFPLQKQAKNLHFSSAAFFNFLSRIFFSPVAFKKLVERFFSLSASSDQGDRICW
jgi:hypothetical protein